MKFLNFGSLNYDYVYSVHHIVGAGETISSSKLGIFCGGKGLNQSIALSQAGAQVYHAGMAGPDADTLLRACSEHHINSDYIQRLSERTGNAIIQVSEQGQNSIVLFGGANRLNTREHVDAVLAGFGEGDVLLLQNEINLVDYIIDKAYEKKMFIILNPSPYDEAMNQCDLRKVSLFLLNEVEGFQITGAQAPDDILSSMHARFPNAAIVLTLGKAGVVCLHGGKTYHHGIYRVPVVDTTAAGDTFTGYFVEEFLRSQSVAEALRVASVASSLAVSRKGASSSIPPREEVINANLRLQQ